MDGQTKSCENRNDALSQSYIQGVERVAQQSNDDAGFSFKLPSKVIEEREKAWSSFFDKYADEASDDVELNIDTMEPVINEGRNDKDDDEDGEPREYYSKCRAPFRKLPALIQYWVDTGNPPYQLTGEEDHSETGSSLSEGEYSRSRQSAVLRESIENPKIDEFSPYSSVDTAAYVLSNANVTKKAQTQEIVEGAKRTNKQLATEISLAIEKNTDVSVTHDSVPIPLNNSQTNGTSNSSQSQALMNISLNQGSSVMLSEVLPALQQFDELLEKSKQLKPQRSALSKVRRIRKTAVVVEKTKVAEPTSAACHTQTQKKSLDLSENSVRKTVSLRKLYTGRNSPIDLIVARPSTESSVTTGPNFHPALEPEDLSKSQVPSFVNRARARRKRKRVSVRQSVGVSTLQNNNSQDSQDPVPDDGNNNNDNSKKGNNEVKEGHERYTDFFESLGLTPSKTIIGKDEEIGAATKPNARRIIAEGIENEENEYPNPHFKGQESAESSMKESQNSSSENIAVSPRIDTAKILGNKVPSVRIVRLPEDCLHRYGQAKGQSPVASPCYATDKKNLNIELLTTMTHDSDSSTILICSCNPTNYQSSDSDCSLFTESINHSASKSLLGNSNRTFETSKSAESLSEISEKLKRNSTPIVTTPKPLDNAQKLNNARDVVVRLEKLTDNELLKVAKPTYDCPQTPCNKIPRESPQRTSPISSSVAKTIDVFNSSKPIGTETRCVTIGSRVFGESSQLEASNLKRAKPTRGSFDHTFGMCLDDDDDCFVRLVKEFSPVQRGLVERSKTDRNNTEQESIDENMNGVLKVPEEMIPRPFTRSRGVIGIASSMDDKEDEVIKIDRNLRQEGRSKRISRKIDRKSLRVVSNGAKNKEKVTDEHVKDLTNNDKGIVGLKNRLEKPIKSCDKVSMESNETNDFGRSTKPNNLLGKSKQLENIFGTRDEARSKHKLNELRNARMRSNSERKKIRRIPHDETNVGKLSRITRSARFHTLLNSDTDSYSDNQNSVTAEQRWSRINQPLNRATVFTDEISTDPKTSIDKSSDSKRKSELQNLDDSIGEIVTAVPERNEQSIRLLPSTHNLPRKDSREELKMSNSRRKKKKKESRFTPVARRKDQKTRILGTPIESESDADERKQLRKNSYDSNQSDENVRINKKKLKCLPDANVKKNDSGRETRLRRSKNLFSNILDDVIEDVDLIFSGNGDCQVTKNDHMTQKLNLELPKICKTVTNTRESKITFRTRLNVSDDENVL